MSTITQIRTDVERLQGARNALLAKMQDAEYEVTATSRLDEMVQLLDLSASGDSGTAGEPASTLSLDSLSTWESKSVAPTHSLSYPFTWSSALKSDGSSAGSGTITIKINNVTKARLPIAQGDAEIKAMPTSEEEPDGIGMKLAFVQGDSSTDVAEFMVYGTYNVTFTVRDVFGARDSLSFMLETREAVDFDYLAAAIDDGSYKEKYNVGDKITVDIGNGEMPSLQVGSRNDHMFHGKAVMVIIGKDVDVMSDGTTTIPLTFQMTYDVNSPYDNRVIGQMNLLKDGETENNYYHPGGWGMSYGRNILNTEVYDALPSYIRDRIVTAAKTYYYIDDDNIGNNGTSYDKIWLVSVREASQDNRYETSGCRYEEAISKGNIIRVNGWQRTACPPQGRFFYDIGYPDLDFKKKEMCFCFCIG